jgi:hypothetical protein
MRIVSMRGGGGGACSVSRGAVDADEFVSAATVLVGSDGRGSSSEPREDEPTHEDDDGHGQDGDALAWIHAASE